VKRELKIDGSEINSTVWWNIF